MKKKEHVSINRTIWSACITSTFGYIMFGFLCALSNPDLKSDNILRQMGDSRSFILTQIVSYLFSMIIIGPGIPVYSISTRYNLFVGKICGKKMSYFLGSVAPWIFGFLFTGSSIFAQLLNWSALLFIGIVNFLVPLAVYLKAYLDRERNLATDPESEVHLVLHIYDKVFPRIMRPNTKIWIILLLAIICGLIIIQIVLSLYYQIVLRQKLNDNIE